MPRPLLPRRHRRVGLATVVAAAAAAVVTISMGVVVLVGQPDPDRGEVADSSDASGDTGPVAHVPADDERAVARAADDLIRSMSLPEKVGQLFVCYANGTAADRVSDADAAANKKLFGVRTGAEAVQRFHLGGVVYFSWSNNLDNPRQVARLSNGLQRSALTTGSKVPLLVSTDQEQGTVVRLGAPATELVGSMPLGAGRNAEDAATAARIAGEELRAVGVNQNYAPVADVNVDPHNPVIGVRSFGEAPSLVAELVAASVRGMQSGGSIPTVKHFPGHGDTGVDSHTGLPIINHTRADWDRLDRAPFEAAVDAGVDTVMTGHIVMPQLDRSGNPATLSHPIITGLLREELGFDGVIVTDSLRMAAVRQKYGDDRVPVLALKAGVDQLLMPPSPPRAIEAVVDAVRSGELPESRVDESVRRILRMKLRRGLFDHPYADEHAVERAVGSGANHEAAQRIADHGVTVLTNTGGRLPVRASAVRSALVTGWGATEALAARLAARGVRARTESTGDEPGSGDVRRAVEASRGTDLVVVTTARAAPAGRQAELVSALLRSHRRVVVIAVREPYDVAAFPQAPSLLATYSSAPPSLESAVKVMLGEIRPSGRLPVTIPRAGGGTLFPFGYGLHW